MTDFLDDLRFAGMKPFKSKVWLSSPTMYGDEQRWVDEAIQTNRVSTVGVNINEAEEQAAEYIGCRYAVALSCGTAALHLATKLAGEKVYGQARPNTGTLKGHKVFCSDVTFDARGAQDELWMHKAGKSNPGEILAAIVAFGAEGRTIWKTMHMQPLCPAGQLAKAV